jgi:hypothetical protein
MPNEDDTYGELAPAVRGAKTSAGTPKCRVVSELGMKHHFFVQQVRLRGEPEKVEVSRLAGSSWGG